MATKYACHEPHDVSPDQMTYRIMGKRGPSRGSRPADAGAPECPGWSPSCDVQGHNSSMSH